MSALGRHIFFWLFSRADSNFKLICNFWWRDDDDNNDDDDDDDDNDA